MHDLLVYASVLLIEIGLVYYFAQIRNPCYLETFCVINMLLIGMFAPHMTNLLGHTVNMGAMYYSTVFLIQFIIYRKFGYERSVYNIKFVFTFMVATYILTQPVILLTGTGVDRLASSAIVTILENQSSTTLGAFLAFFVSQFAFIQISKSLGNKHLIFDYVSAIVIAQCLDSLIFYVIAFSDKFSAQQLVVLFTTGTVFKIGIGLCTIPLLLLLQKKKLI